MRADFLSSAQRREVARAVCACPLCHGPSTVELEAADINRSVSAVVYSLHRCGACGLLFVSNPPVDVGVYYTSDYHPRSSNNCVGQEPNDPHGLHRSRFNLVSKFKNQGALLEIGPSVGAFCLLAQKAGFRVSAIEMDHDCVSALNSFGIRAIQSNDPSTVIAKEARPYDAICLWHSLEHLHHPWRVLEQCAKHLSPDGIIVVAMPNPDAWQARIIGAAWAHYDLPRHLFLLPIPWIYRFAQRSGLVIEMVTTRDRPNIYLSIIGWREFIVRSLGRHFPRRLARLVGLLVGIMLLPFDCRKGAGAAYTVILRRPAREFLY